MSTTPADIKHLHVVYMNAKSIKKQGNTVIYNQCHTVKTSYICVSVTVAENEADVSVETF